MQPIINVIKQNKFTLQNVNDYKQLVPEAAYPELYGADLPPQITYAYTDLIDIDRLQKTPYGFVGCCSDMEGLQLLPQIVH